MKVLLIIIITFFLVVIQASAFPYLEIHGATPNLVLILVLIMSILKEQRKNLVWALSGGFFLDLFGSNNFLGISALTIAAIGLLTKVVFQNFFKKPSILTIIIIVASGLVVYNIVLVVFDRSNLHFLFSQVVYNMIVMVPLFYIVKWINDRK